MPAVPNNNEELRLLTRIAVDVSVHAPPLYMRFTAVASPFIQGGTELLYPGQAIGQNPSSAAVAVAVKVPSPC